MKNIFFVLMVFLAGGCGGAQSLPPVNHQVQIFPNPSVPRALWGVSPSDYQLVSDKEASMIRGK
ncbi:MAG: hypothetical protein PHF35_02250 [Candidatus Moranbacteria bacterium]|nr:hypothetical protein [Candidatus Moranbacteria bacterium]